MARLVRSTALSGRASDTFGSFRHRDFSLVWVSANIAMVGRQMEVIAILWLVLELTGNAVLVGLAGAAPLSLAFLSVFAGAVVDRLPRRRLLAVMQFIAAALAFVLMALLLMDTLKVWMIFVVIIGGGMFRTFELPVTNALLIDTVARDRLTNAVAMLGFGQNLTQFIGPIVAGFLFTPLTPGGLFALIGALYAVGGVLALLVRTRNLTVGNTTPRQVIIGVAAGLKPRLGAQGTFHGSAHRRHVQRHRLPVHHGADAHFRPRHPQGGVEALGLLNGAMGAGAVVGALVVAGLGNLRRQGWWLVWAVNGGWHASMILFAVAVMILPGLLPYAAVLAIAMAIKVLTGIGRSVSLVLVMTVLMGNSDPEFRGRMGGMRVLAIQAHFPASALNGWMVTQIGAPWTALSLGVAGTVAVFLCLLSRRLREA